MKAYYHTDTNECRSIYIYVGKPKNHNDTDNDTTQNDITICSISNSNNTVTMIYVLTNYSLRLQMYCRQYISYLVIKFVL